MTTCQLVREDETGCHKEAFTQRSTDIIPPLPEWLTEVPQEHWDWVEKNMRMLSVFGVKLWHMHRPSRFLSHTDRMIVLIPAVLRSLSSFGEGMNASHSTYVWTKLKWMVSKRNARYHTRKFFKKKQGDTAIHPNPILLGHLDPVAAPEGHETSLCLQDDAMDAYRKLPDRVQSAISQALGLFGPAKSQREIALEMGVSRSRVGQLIESGLAFIRERLSAGANPAAKTGVRTAMQLHAAEKSLKTIKSITSPERAFGYVYGQACKKAKRLMLACEDPAIRSELEWQMCRVRELARQKSKP